MSIYGEIYDTRPIEKDFDWIVVYDLDLRAVYIGRGYPFACSLNISADCAEVNEPLDFVVMGGVDGRIYRAYDDGFYSHGCPGPLIHWYAARPQNFNALNPAVGASNILTIRSHDFEVTGTTPTSLSALSGMTFNLATSEGWISGGHTDGGNFYSFSVFTLSSPSLVGPTGFTAVHALAVDEVSGIIYGSASVTPGNTFPSADRLISIDPNTGVGTLIGFYGSSGGYTIQGIECLTIDRDTGILYGIGWLHDGITSLARWQVFTIDKTTGAATVVATLLEDVTNNLFGGSGPSGITIDNYGNWYGSIGGGDGRIIAINPSTWRFSIIFDATTAPPQSVSDIIWFPFQPLTNNVRLDITPGPLPLADDGLKGIPFTNLRQPGSTRPVLTRLIESHSNHELRIAEPFWVANEFPDPGDLIVIGLISPFVDFAEQSPRYQIAVERIGFDAKSGDDDELQYTFQVFAADQGKSEVNLTAPAAQRTFTESEVVRQKQGLGIRRFPTRALRPRLTWHQLSAAMEIRRLDLDYQVYEREDSRG